MSNVLTKDCPRCGGSGHYSFNPIHGTRCFKCNGAGKILANPRAKGNVVTSQFRYAEAGDVVQLDGYGTCKVLSVDTGEFIAKDRETYAQRVTVESLIDGKVRKILRDIPSTEFTRDGKTYRVNKKTGVWTIVED